MTNVQLTDSGVVRPTVAIAYHLAAITTPDSVETRLGTLKFFDGFPDNATVQRSMDNRDFQRGVIECSIGPGLNCFLLRLDDRRLLLRSRPPSPLS